MEIGATKAVQERLKTIKAEAVTGVLPVFCWDTHLVKRKGRNMLLIVNVSNRYTIAMTDIKPRNWNDYAQYIGRVIQGMMQDMGYLQDQVQKYFSMSGDLLVTKTHGKKSVGGMHRMATLIEYYGKNLEKDTKYQRELSKYLNKDICKPEGFDAYGYPYELFHLDMEQIGISVKRSPAKIIDFETYLKNERGTAD